MNKKIYKIILIVMFFMPTMLIFIVPIRGEKEISKLESRKLEEIPDFSFSSFFDGSFQDKLEKSITDQMILSQTIKVNIKKLKNSINTHVYSFLITNKKNCKGYIEVVDGYYSYNCSTYLIEKPVINYRDEVFESNKSVYNNIRADKYIYFIEKDRSINFDNIEEKNKWFEGIKKNFKAKKYAKFSLNSYNDLEEYFYQTDHHWNYKGSYKGYTEIIELLFGKKEKVLKPLKVEQFNVIFNGSASRKSLTNLSNERFAVFTFNTPRYKSYINDKAKNYGSKENYLNNNYKSDLYTNHYSLYYGGDFAKVEYDFNNKNKENLLILATSYSNAINDLIASHFNKTYVIDLRFYKEHYNQDLDINKFIKNNNIDKVLIMGDIYSFAKEDKNAL